MKNIFKAGLAWLLAAVVALPLPGSAQNAAGDAPLFKNEQIEQLVAPIALYPDPLIAQILMASTYPLEVVSAARWSKANPNVKDKALEDAMQQQPWDASVKSLTAFPQVLAMMSEKLELTQSLGDAFLAQQKDVLAAIQRLRGKAEQAGNLKSGKEQNVTTVNENNQTIIKIEPTNPEVVYVPTYQPAVYGPWPYPSYPPYTYYPPGYVPGAMLFSFAVGVAVGNAMWGNTNWGGGDVNINNTKYNNFNRTNVGSGAGSGKWEHRPEHRKGAGYRDRGSQERFGSQRPGVDSREQFRGRAEQGRNDIGRGDADRFKGQGGIGDRGGVGDRGGFGDRGGVGDRGGMGDRGGFGDRGGAGGGRDFGNRGGGFQGVGSGGQTRDFSNRGASSRGGNGGFSGGSRAGGGAAAGGGARGGGARGGGAAAGGGARSGGGARGGGRR